MEDSETCSSGKSARAAVSRLRRVRLSISHFPTMDVVLFNHEELFSLKEGVTKVLVE